MPLDPSSPLAQLLAFAGSSGASSASLMIIVPLAALAAYLFARMVVATASFLRISRGLASIPSAPGGLPLLGHVLPMLTGVRHGKGAWDVMEDWLNAKGPIVKYNIMGTQGVAVCDPAALKRIFQTGYKMYEKDLALSYRPFLPILGTGLVTSDGALWQKQRMLMGPALRVDVLDDIIRIAKKAVDRLCEKLSSHAASGESVDIEDEFRLLTLQGMGCACLAEDDPVGLMGHPLPRGIMVACHLQGTHKMYEAPSEFRPARFMPGGEYDAFDDATRAYMFVPFIQGPRNCLGQHLALLEARVVLSLLLQRYSFRLVDPDNAGRRHPTIIPVGPVGGLKVFVAERGRAAA
ncbi:Protein LUTEIN DEFICIENT 5, chloroplastic [Tetrabaena socialis]|uniref:Protein LUTEIN DEFICIENT 5, chloroplastic n=1 Tax=Tetrabaena socialis TaxID=47790 RepID=A0A2J8A598_9CHLO|nr:Protein LUTEIN DEFICIENT 5, chloroplastic [Tetrabaena socialis]|eukprot:PNH07696.1 Protein LUTEIN DEFICIENT 5, chloroplastic [Tetrabaena socialis]